jgi:hypothetical protein
VIIPIPYAIDYTAVASGQAIKLVGCEQCGAEYVYQVMRTATGEGTSFLFLNNEGASKLASSRAESRIQEVLERCVDLVPCPTCGWYQRDMVPKARRLHRRWMLNLGACLTIGLIPVAVIGALVNAAMERQGRRGLPVLPTVGILAFFGLLGVGLVIGKFVSAYLYNPNQEDVESRKRLGQSHAILRKELENMLQDSQEVPERRFRPVKINPPPADARDKVTIDPHARSRSVKSDPIQVAGLRRNLRLKVSYDEAEIDRLIEAERTRMPEASEVEWYRAAIERWEQDNR